MCVSLAESLQVDDIVSFPGFRRDIPAFQAAFDLYAQPSTQGEMFPNAIVEAMAMRNCWVGSDLSGLSELSANGAAGSLVPPGDLEALTDSVAALLAAPQTLRSRGDDARRFVEQNLTVADVVDRVEAAYREAAR